MTYELLLETQNKRWKTGNPLSGQIFKNVSYWTSMDNMIVI